MKRDTRRFGRKGAFTCHACGKLTRDTGHDEGALQLCKRCLFESYAENARSDYGDGSPEHKAALERLASAT